MRVAVAALALLLPLPAVAQVVDRELSTDRPDKTESPYTVPAGRIQIEMDLANYTRDRRDGQRIETIGFAPFNVKLGIDRDTDVQLVVAPYIRRTLRDALWWADMTTDPDGGVVNVHDRILEIQTRYGETDLVTFFIRQAKVELISAVNRTEERLRAAGVNYLAK